MNFTPLDQASELRDLIHHKRTQPVVKRHGAAGAKTIAITSGKGGVGKSVVALNLAIALAQSGQRVCLFDADLGLGNLDLLCGLNGYWNLSHVVNNVRSLSEVMLTGPAGISIIPGASGLTELTDLSTSARTTLLEQLAQLEQEFDFLLIDCGTGIHRQVRQFAQAAETVLLLTTLEATSLADTYAAYKVFHTASLADVRLIFNRTTASQAQQAIHNLRTTARQYLQAEISVLGCLSEDPLLSQSVSRRQPFQLHHSETVLGQNLAHLARLLNEQRYAVPSQHTSPFIKRLQSEVLSAA